MLEITTEKVALDVADGTRMSAHAAKPHGGGHRHGVLVLQEAFGVNAHIRDVAERLAREGFVAIAPELFHRTAPGFDARYDDFPSVMKHLRALTTEGLIADLTAANAWLSERGGVAPGDASAIGFCMGGRDKHIPPEQIAAVTSALRASGKTFVNAEFSDGDHGFFCDARPSYHPASAAQAWALALQFLRPRAG